MKKDDKGRKTLLKKRALNLSYFTVVYNIAEGIISIIAGYLARSVALVGFGMDSAVESLSGGVMIWRFRKKDGLSKEEEERIERKAAKFVAATFFILGAYVLFVSIKKLYLREEPDPSVIGIIIAIASLFLMPVLYLMKNRTGKELRSKSLIADSKETLACTFLSVALLIGLALNYFFGLWYADPVVGIVIVGFLFKEGYEVLEDDD